MRNALLLASATIGCLIGAATIHAQTSTQWSHATYSGKSPSVGSQRDFWFAIPQIFSTQDSLKHLHLFISADQATTVQLQIGNSTPQSLSAIADSVYDIELPTQWELQSSGVVEAKGIHVWSATSGLHVSELSMNTQTSDGLTVLPTSQLSTSYVVASYTSLFELTLDDPSEFAVVAQSNNTMIQVTPSWNIRANGQPNTVLHAHDLPFADQLSSGTAIEYQLTQAQNTDDFDVTESLVTSNLPVGVMGACQCANIPPDFPYCGYVSEMIPPIDAWDTSYYANEFIARKGGNSIAVIASGDGQTIRRADNTGVHTVAQLNRYEYFREADIDVAQHYFSNKPFLLVQYLNSTGWPDGGALNNGVGAPSMVVVPGVNHYTRNAAFIIPPASLKYASYVNVWLPATALPSTRLDTIPVLSHPNGTRTQVDSFVCIRYAGLSPGVHHLVSTAPIGGYLYGYGLYNSYAWPMSVAADTSSTSTLTLTLNKTTNNCGCTTVEVAERPGDSITDVSIVSLMNARVSIDSSYRTTHGARTSTYSVCAVDPTSIASATIATMDGSGGALSVVSSYRPQLDFSSRQLSFYDTSTTSVQTLSVTNYGASTYYLDTNHVKLSGPNVSIVSQSADSILPNGVARLTLRFTERKFGTSTETLTLSDSCQRYTINLTTPTWSITDDTTHSKCVDIGTWRFDTIVIHNNYSNATLEIDSLRFSDPGFVYTGPLPLFISPQSQSTIIVIFQPSNTGQYNATAIATAKGGQKYTLYLRGCAQLPNNVNEPSTVAAHTELLELAPNPLDAGTGTNATLRISLDRRAPISVTLFDLLGREQLDISQDLWHPAGVTELHFNTASLPSGTYICRFEALGEIHSAKLLIR